MLRKKKTHVKFALGYRKTCQTIDSNFRAGFNKTFVI